MSKLTDLLNNPAAQKRYACVATAYDPRPPGRNISFPISTHGLVSLPTDGIANYPFAPRIGESGLPVFERALFSQGRLSGSSSSPETSLTAIAADGNIDYFYDYAWAGRRFDLFMGSEGFSFNEYGQVIVLVQGDPTYTDDTITIPLRDISFLTDTEIQSARYQGTGGTEGSGEVGGKLKPEAWGFCPKVQPIYLGLDASGRHQFGVGSGPIVGVLRVWDRASLLEPVASNPQPGQYSIDVSTGTIVLGGAFLGPVQADVVGRRYVSVPSATAQTISGGTKTFAVTAGPPEPQISVGMWVRCIATADPSMTYLDGIVTGTRPGNQISVAVQGGRGSGTYSSWIICPWGTPAGILCAMAETVLGTTVYTDTAARVALNNVQPARCGYWVPQGGNGKQLLDLVAEGTGCYWLITRFNTFRVGRIDLPSGEPVASYDEAAILSLERISTDEPAWQVVLKHGRQWSTLTQDQISGVANPLEFIEEWQTMIGEAEDIRSVYRSDNRIEIETIFQEFNAAQTELFRQFNIFSFPRKDYFRISQKRDLMSLGLGNVISIKYPRYGLSSGKLLTIVDIKEDYNTGIVEMGGVGLMANLHVLAENYADAGGYSGGAWVSTLPLTFLKTSFLNEVARSAGLDAASATFTADLLLTRPLSQFALVGHNLSADGSVRIRVSDSADASSPALDVIVAVRQPNVVWGSMPWGAFPWDGYLPGQPGTPMLFYEHPASVLGRYVRIDFADAGNPAGFVQVGRFICGEPWVPRINMAYGASLGRIDESTATRSRGGQAFWDKRTTRRKLAVQLGFLTEGEALGAIYDMQARLGLTGNLLVSYDPAEGSAVRQRRTLYAAPTQLDDTVTASASIDYPYSCNLSFEEII